MSAHQREPLPPKAQAALGLWLAAHMDELRALLLAWDIAPERLTTPTFTYSVTNDLSLASQPAPAESNDTD